VAPHFPQLEILGLLGQGGMGAVYRARQTKLDRLVALKILPPEAGRDPAFAARFGREARTLARLSHPNIVAVHDFGEAGGLYFFLMEFVDGMNLRQLLQAGRQGLSETLKVFLQICDALQYAHEEGVIHRDVKPENILLDRRGRVKMADFGLAKLLGATLAEGRLTVTRQVMGTLRYMAPEQLEGAAQIDHRADIYSLGVVLYEMLTGTSPLGRFAPPSEAGPVDPRFDAVVLRTLEKDPGRRYQQVRDLKAAIEAAVRGAGLATPADRTEVAVPVRPAPRAGCLSVLTNPALWAFVVCLVGLAACFEPFDAWADIRLGTGWYDPSLAAVQGFQCPAGLVPGVLFLVLCCVFLATGFPARAPRWQPGPLILAGACVAGFTGWSILWTGSEAPPAGKTTAISTMPAALGVTERKGPGIPPQEPPPVVKKGSARVRLLGNSVAVDYDLAFGSQGARGYFVADGKELEVRENRVHVSERRPLSALTTRVHAWPYVVGLLGLALLFLGCIQLRRAWAPYEGRPAARTGGG
jgi:hypothetical protein